MSERKYAINPREVEPEYQELAARLNFDGSKYLPRILKKAFTLEQARLALELYASPEDIARTLEITVDEVGKDLNRHQAAAISRKLAISSEVVAHHIRYMFELGFAFPTRQGWKFARTSHQIKDSQTNPKYDAQLGDEYFDLWEAFQKIEVYPTTGPARFAVAQKYGPSYRVIPVMKSLANMNDIVREDNLAAILKLYATIAVEHCPCKRLVRDRACHSETEVCLIFDRVAEHNIRRGAARIISLDEAMAIHEASDKGGMVCLAQSNEAKPTRLPMICHCHWCCCDALAVAVMQGFPMRTWLAPSCYQAQVEPAKCTGCQKCVTRCQFGAIQMKHYPGSGKQERMKAWVDPEKCMGCGLCVTACPAGARTMFMVKSGDSIPGESTIPSLFTAAPPHSAGKHIETGSVMTRPISL